jgi:hypothetical protein
MSDSGKTSKDDNEAKTPSWVDQDPFEDRIRPRPGAKSSAVSGVLETRSPPAVESSPETRERVIASPTLTDLPAPKTGLAEERVKNLPLGQRVADRAPPAATSRPSSVADNKRGPRLVGIPIWLLSLVVLVSIVGLWLYLDFRNRSRFRLVCEKQQLRAERGRGLPWPLGFEPLSGPFQPLALPPDANCRTQAFSSSEEAESALLDALVAQAQRALSSARQMPPKHVRIQLQQAALITGLEAHRGRRREVEQLLADLAYREGRAGLAQAEGELRIALSRLQEAQRLASERYVDLKSWIQHLEHVLRKITPSPRVPQPDHPPVPERPTPPEKTPPATPSQKALQPALGPDAGPPRDMTNEHPGTGGAGILM